MNDPVGIALMIGVIELATEDDGDLWIVAREFAIEMAVGLVVGVVGALLLLPVLRRVRLTGPALYPIRVLAGAGIVYGLAAVAGGSGFLAVFVAGLVLGDAAATRKGEIEDFHASLAGLAEIAAFVALGLSIGISDLGELDLWVDGLAIAVVLACVARPVAVLPLPLPARLHWGERLFVVWGGLKGARCRSSPLARRDRRRRQRRAPLRSRLHRPPLLGRSSRARRCPAPRPGFASRFGVWTTTSRRCSSSSSATTPTPAAAQSESSRSGERAWVGVLIRDGRPLPVETGTVFRPGDRVHVYSQPEGRRRARPHLRRRVRVTTHSALIRTTYAKR